MQPFKLVPSLTSSRIPGRIASPKLRVLRPRGCLDGLKPASQGMGGAMTHVSHVCEVTCVAPTLMTQIQDV